MGLVLFPILLVSFVLFAACAYYIYQCISRGELRILSIGEGALVAVLLNVLFFTIWNNMGTVWVFAPVITMALVSIIFPGGYWFYDRFIIKNTDSRWSQASAWCVVIASFIYMFLFDKLQHLDQLLDVKLTH